MGIQQSKDNSCAVGQPKEFIIQIVQTYKIKSPHPEGNEKGRKQINQKVNEIQLYIKYPLVFFQVAEDSFGNFSTSYKTHNLHIKVSLIIIVTYVIWTCNKTTGFCTTWWYIYNEVVRLVPVLLTLWKIIHRVSEQHFKLVRFSAFKNDVCYMYVF